MTAKPANPATVDEYISRFSPVVQAILEKIRATIKKAVPAATETIAYQIPTFKLNSKNLVHFAAFKNHVGFYPTPSGMAAFKDELSSFTSAKGSVQFPLGRPIPYDLIEKMAAFRAREVLQGLQGS